MKKRLLLFFVIGTLLPGFLHLANAQNFIHPGGLVTQNDIDRIQYLLNMEGDATIKAAFNKLKANSHAQSSYNPNPQERVSRGDATLGDNYSIAMNDVAAAYQNALMWRITGTTAYADCAVRILNGWARVCKRITGDTNASLASGIYGYEFAQAGELLRGYSGWAAADFKAYQNWMRQLWYPRAMYFIVKRHGRTCDTNEGGAYMSNWGLCNLLAIMSIGILCDDVAIYNQGLHFYKDDICGNFTDEYRSPIKDIGNNEFLGNLVVWLHPDLRGPYGYLGQMQESGRDQGHATMAAGLAADVCQTAWNQGDDLYSYMNNRIAAGFEYIALVNSLPSSDVVADSIPFMPYLREGLPTENYLMTSNGLGGWGSVRPYWDRIVAHYGYYKGVEMKYSRKMKEITGIDGGGGDYGSTSGGYDHLGFSTITNYIPQSWYPAAGNAPVVLTPHIILNGTTIDDSRKSGVTAGSGITLSPMLPAGVTGGTWQWDTGETTRELTFNAQKSSIRRVTYTASNGRTTVQAFTIAILGDCTPDIISYQATVGDISYKDTVITVLPYQKFSLGISTAMYDRGSALWSTGSGGFNLTVTNGVRTDSIFWVEHTNEGGYKTRVRFHVKMTYVTPSYSIDGGNDVSSNQAAVEAGQNVELKPVTTTGYNGGTFRWNTGHTAQNLLVLNVQKGAKYTVCYTLVKNGVTTVDTLNFTIGVKKSVYQLANGDYYIRRTSDGAYLTNPNATASEKVKPYFVAEKSSTDSVSQIWTISKETASGGSGRFKIVAKKNGNYINENCEFGTNPYYPAWNTYTFYCLEGEDLYAIQNGGSSGTKYWAIVGDQITGKGTDSQDGYPFLIQNVNPGSLVVAPPATGENVLSYIAPAYSIDGGKSQIGSKITLELGQTLALKPYKVSNISGGSWLWSDSSNGSMLDLGTIQNGGTYSVSFTYPEGDTAYVFKLNYSVTALPSSGIEDQAGDVGFRIYPNPADDYLVVDIPANNYESAIFILYSIDGQTVKTISCVAGSNRLNLVGLHKGLYVAALKINGEMEKLKIIKK